MYLHQFRGALLAWWQYARRDFPWRTTSNPYHILIAEVLLHRTRAAQVVNLFHAMLRCYPSVEALAAADPNDLQHILHSAGLRWRVELLSQSAREIVQRFGGEIPKSREDLQSIPGIGHYISAAIRCFAFGEPDAIVDSNVVRIYARVFSLEVTDQLRRNRDFHELARSLVDPQHPREYNLALLDLAAAICTPRNPKCEECPILQYCDFGRSQLSVNPPPSPLQAVEFQVPVGLRRRLAD